MLVTLLGLTDSLSGKVQLEELILTPIVLLVRSVSFGFNNREKSNATDTLQAIPIQFMLI